MSQPYSYRPVMNRNVTRKWAEARQVDYDGDDWGADPYDEEPEYTQPALSQGGRSFTNPTQLNTNHRLSFDQGAEQRVFSDGAVGSQPGFSSTNQAASSQFRPLQSNVPQARPQNQGFESSGRTSSDRYDRDVQQSDDGPSAAATRGFPPRKSSLSQPNIPDFGAALPTQQQESKPPVTDTKPLPFIRPADIYKRMEEEKEKERRSQESSRPSFDSLQRDQSESTPKQSMDEGAKRRQPALDTVAERKSEYGMEGLLPSSDAPQSSARSEGPSQIDTDLTQGQSIPSASSLYTDRPDSIATDSQFPSRNVSQHDSKVNSRPGFLPELTRTSTFGSDFIRTGGSSANQQRTDQLPSQTSGQVSSRQDSTNDGSYRNMVDDAFRSQNNTLGSPAQTEDSLLRSNTTSTSQISPIVERSNERDWNPDLARHAELSRPHESDRSPEQIVEDLGAPRRIGTNRRNSPSPARRPLSMVVPPVSEPQSAVLSPGNPELPRSTATETQISRPGPAILVHQKRPSDDIVPKSESSGIAAAPGTTATSTANPGLRKQESHLSDTSDPSNLRTASDEWRDWSKARREFNAQHGIKDSNPTTPGFESPSMASTTPSFDSLGRNMATSASGRPGEDTKALPNVPSVPPLNRPIATRDESFRPSLPGGWQSSTSIQKTTSTDPTSTNHPQSDNTSSIARTESVESIPTAGAPRRADWRSEYNGPQAQAFAAAATAGSALAGIFSGRALTSRGGDSEVSSIDEHDDEPTGQNRDSSLIHRDFASVTPPPPAVPDQYATRDFANTSPPKRETSMNTPKASQQPFSSTSESLPSVSRAGQAPVVGRSSLEERRAESPSKESERWWSDDEDQDTSAHAPAPLRTKRLSTVESAERRSPISQPGRHGAHSPTHEQLESDIVKSLTPKSSRLDNTEARDLTYGPKLSPTRTDHNRGGSPPFSAAAIAMSPARDYKKLEEQNTFKPLSAPSSRPQTPSRSKGQAEAFSTPNMPDPTKPTSFTIGKQSGRTNQPQVPFTETSPASGNDREDTSKTSDFSRPARTASKDFSAVPATSTLAPDPLTKSVDRQPESSVSSGKPFSTGSPVGTSGTTSLYPTTATETRTPAPLTGPHPSTSSALQENRTSPDSSNVSSATPLTTISTGGATKPLPNPVALGNSQTQRPATPDSISRSSSSAKSPIVPRADTTTQRTPYDTNKSFPTDKVPVEQIFGMGSAQQRINAYNDNRQAYAEPVGQLENWLTHMRSNEHADAFTPLPITKTDQATSSPRHKRDVSTTPSGTKVMQEDGKRLLASASKYGVKAGVLGKGLFSKGKEKLRTVSASQKGGSTTRKNNIPDNSRSVSSNSVPQLPTPSMGTPVDDSSFSAYFPSRENTTAPTQGPKAAVAPPFSPISEVSTNQNELGRSTSAVSDEDTFHSSRSQGPRISTAPTYKSTEPLGNDKRKSAGAVSARESERDERDLLNPSGMTHERRNSSVSDVSSVSDSPNRRQSLAARTVSPPIEHQISRDDPTYGPMPVQVSGVTNNNNRSGHAPSYSYAMASKESEASRDRVDEPSLPAYGQAQPKPTTATTGAQIVPIARLRQDQDVRAEEPRPFSFVGNDSLLHAGHGTNHSIDNPGVSTVPSAMNANERLMGNQSGVGLASASNARDNPAQPSRIQTQTQAEEQYRIPGPYGHELRSPRPKTSSPMLEQLRSPTTPQSAADAGAGANSQRAVTSDYTPFPPPQHSHQTSGPEQNLPTNAYDSRQGMGQQASHQQRPSNMDYDREKSRERDRDRDRERERDRDRYGERSRDRGRTSKLSALFRSRSKSRSRRLQKERSRTGEQRPDNSRRNSLFKMGTRNSMSRDNSYNDSQGADYDEASDQYARGGSRPATAPRRLSKDLFKSATHNQSDKSYGNPAQQEYADRNKKKRFSGLFGKSPSKYDQHQSEGPARSSNQPLSSQQSNQGSNYHDRPYGPETRATQDSHSYGQPSQSHVQSRDSFQGGDTADTRPYGPQREQSDMYNNDAYVQQSNERPDMSSQYSSTSYLNPQQAGSPFTHENRANPYEQTLSQQHEQARPILPRLNTGDNRSGNVTPVPASAPAVPMSYLQTLRQNQSNAPTQTQTLPQDAYYQQYQQMSFPQPPALTQYYQPPTTHAARDISHNSTLHDRTLNSSTTMSRDNDYNDRQMASPLPMSAPFSESSTLINPISNNLSPATAPNPTYQNAQYQPTPAYTQPQSSQPTSRITPRVAQLHTRSRSPKLGRRSSEDLDQEFETAHQGLAVNQPRSATSVSPVAGLGTFSGKKVSPMGGTPRSAEEQEKPWAITLPVDEDERRRREGDPESATSSKAREMKRILLEKSPGATPATAASTQAPAGQTVADRFVSHGLPSQQQKTNENQIPQPGGQKVLPTSRTSTPIIIGRPKSPSVSIRRDASLRGKGPSRKSTMIDEAGRVLPVGGPQRKDTPTSFLDQPSGRNSLDVRRSSSVSISSKDHSQRDPTTIATPSTAPTSRTTSTPPPPVPKLTLLPGMTKGQSAAAPSVPVQHHDTANTGTDSMVAPAIAAAATTGAIGASGASATSEHKSRTSTEGTPSTNLKNVPSDTQQDEQSEVYEMAGSRPEGYESDEEPTMSATAYPGQEWQPAFEAWED